MAFILTSDKLSQLPIAALCTGGLLACNTALVVVAGCALNRQGNISAAACHK